MLRVFHHYISGRKVSLYAAETFVVALCAAAGLGLATGARPGPGTLWLLAIAFVVSFQFTIYLFDLYDLKTASEDRARGARLLRAMGAGFLGWGLVAAVLGAKMPEGLLMRGALGAFLGVFLVRLSYQTLLGEPPRVFIVGNGMKALGLVKMIAREKTFQVVGMAEPGRAGTHGPSMETLDARARRLRAEFVVMAVDEPRGADWVEDLLRCRLDGRRVYDVAGFCERVLRRIPVAHFRVSGLTFSDHITTSSYRAPGKRILDITVALVVLVLGAPLMLLVALLIRLDSKGPIFYRQERVGRRGRPYSLWKFRSMRTDAEKDGAVWARANDERITHVGKLLRKTRIDELPQVFNVLKGDMSFVGPRPERPVFMSRLKEAIPFYGLREAVKPGITGWAQICYPYGASVEDARNKLELDLYYIKNGTLFLDVAIIFHTVRHVLFGRGAR